MAGGLFNRPFVLNEKCIFFALICMGLFLYKPNFKNQYVLYLVLFIIFLVAYVSMAWYDYFFDCDILPFKRGKISISGLFKPPAHNLDKQNNNKETSLDTKKRSLLIYLSHILFIVPLLIYISIYKNKVNKIIYPLLLVLAIFTLSYHGIALITWIY